MARSGSLLSLAMVGLVALNHALPGTVRTGQGVGCYTDSSGRQQRFSLITWLAGTTGLTRYELYLIDIRVVCGVFFVEIPDIAG